MTRGDPLGSRIITLALIGSFLLAWTGCNQSQQTPAPAKPAATAAAAGEQVFIQFEGPWAFAPDPKDSNLVVAIAPKSKGHRDLFVKASNQSTLAAGNYQLSVPSRTGAAAGTVDPNIAQAKIDAAGLERALNDPSDHYIVRVPKPDAYIAAGRYRSRIGASYPPDASTEKEYATAVSLRYAVASRSGFSIAGTSKRGSFNPMLLQVETPMVRFAIEPAQEDDRADKCDTHSRESFHELTRLLGLKLYVDFPDTPADCQKKDPQNVPVKASLSHDSVMLLAMRATEEQAAQRASVVDLFEIGNWHQWLAMLFFARPLLDCKAPVLVLSTS